MTDELGKVAEDSARGGFLLISGTALATLILAIASILIGRVLGPELYGQYTLVFVVPQLLFLFTDLGINQGIVKFTASLRAKGDTDRLTRIIQSGLLIKAFTGLAIFMVSYFLADWFALFFLQRPDLAFYVRIASIGIVFQVIFSTATSAFVGLDKTEYNALTTNIQAIAKAIISIALVLLGFSVTGAIIGSVASYIAAAIAGVLMLFIVALKKHEKKTSYRIGDDFRTLIDYGTPLYISLLLTGFVPIFQNVMLAIFASDLDIGNYKAATNFATVMTVVSIPITTALLPAFSKFNSGAIQKIKLFFRLSNKYTAMLIVPLTVLIIMYSTEIVQTIYGSTYGSAPLFLAIYCLLYFLVGFGYLTLTSFFNGLGETKTSLGISLITFLSLAALSPLLTGTYGVPGLIIAFLIGNVTGTLYGLYTAKRRFQIELGTITLAKIYLISLLAALPSLLMLRFASLPQIVDFAVGGVIYLLIYTTLVPLTKVISASEVQMVGQITRRIQLLKLFAGPILRYEQRLLEIKQEPKKKYNP
jgi:O-antigen/teichoic acid export membrane protein